MSLGNLILLARNLPLIPYLARLVNISPAILIPLIMVFSLSCEFLTTLNPFDMVLMPILAVAALLLRWAGFPLTPNLLGFIMSGCSRRMSAAT